MRKKTVVLDASCLIALQAEEQLAEKLKKNIIEKWDPYCTELAILETYYILCRKLDWNTAKSKINALKDSNVIQIKPINIILEDAVLLKCQRSISIADCLTIALAKILQGQAIFYQKEKELDKAMENKPFDVKIIFFR